MDSEIEKLKEENKILKETLVKIVSNEEKFNDIHPEYVLLKCCALAKNALSKIK